MASELKSDEIYHYFSQKTVENSKIPYFVSFRPSFFGQNGVKCYPISTLRPDLESSYQGASLEGRLSPHSTKNMD